jgi:hypothetical protein
VSAAGRSEMSQFNRWDGETVQVAVATAPRENLLRAVGFGLRGAMLIYAYQILLRILLLAKRWNY